MAGSIQEFKSTFKRDLARPNRFDVFINVPPVISSLAGQSQRQVARSLRYNCESTNLPSRTFATTEQKTYGPIEKYPYLTTYNDLDITLIVDDAMSQKYIFDSWMEYINPAFTNDFKYKEDYATVLTVNQYNLQNELVYAVDFFECYPISINQMDLDWQLEGYHKLNVTFAYTRWFNRTLVL
jgi:hypothetical protein